MPLSNVDRKLLTHCFQKRPFAWESFVDRFLTLIVFAVKHTARRRQIALTEHDAFDVVSDVFLSLMRDDFAALRRFRGKSSLATYLTVVTRRVVVRKLVRINRGQVPLSIATAQPAELLAINLESATPAEIDSMLSVLDPLEASVVRMFHLEQKTLEQISEATGIAPASIGPLLLDAVRKMQQHISVNQGA